MSEEATKTYEANITKLGDEIAGLERCGVVLICLSAASSKWLGARPPYIGRLVGP